MLAQLDILEPVRKRLEQVLKMPVEAIHPTSSHGPDGTFHASNYLFVVKTKSSSRLATIRQACDQAQQFAAMAGPDAIPLVAVPFMGPTGRQVCDQAGVSYIDAAGNAHIAAPGLYIHIEGKRDQFAARGRPSSAFSPKSSRVTRLLLQDPKRLWKQSEMATQAHIGKSLVSKITARLFEQGLLEINQAKRIRPSNPSLLLEAWKDEYQFRRHRIMAGHVSSRSGEELADRFATLARELNIDYSFTGLPAAFKLAPFAGFRLVAAYLHQVPPDHFLDALGFHPEEKGANTWLIVPNDEGVFTGSKEIDGHVCVSPVQAYLDLQEMPERAKEAAEHVREVCLKWQ